MNARQQRAFARLDRAARHLRNLVRLKDPPPLYERFAAKFQVSVARLRELEEEQKTASPQRGVEGRETANLRKRLRREYMIPLTRTGKRLLRFAPGVEQALKVPHARASHRELVTGAEVMLKAVRPHRALLTSAGFPATFLTELRDLTRELKRIATTSSARQAKFARVSRELREELANGNETLRILDGLVLARMDRDRHLAGTWKELLRTPKPLGRPRAKKRKVGPNVPSSHGSGEEPLTV